MADTTTESKVLVFCDIVLVIIFVIGVVANSLVLLVFYRKPGLRTISNRFVINLVATHLAACFVELPLVLTDNLLGPTAGVRTWLCAVDEGITAAVCSASVLAVLLIALDQYWAVVDPLRYHARIGAARSAGMILSAWFVALIFGICGGVDLATTPRSSMWYSCGSSSKPLDPETSTLYPTLFAVTFTTCIFVLPFTAILWIYICIYTAAHRNSQRTRRRGSSAIVTNSDRQYFPIVDTHNDCEANKPAVRKNSINLQRSQTFAETDVKTRSVRKSSEGDLSFQSLKINARGDDNDMLDPRKSVKTKCPTEIVKDSNNTSVSLFVAIAVPNENELTKEISRQNELASHELDNNSTKFVGATFCLGAPEVNSNPEFEPAPEVTDEEVQCNTAIEDTTNITQTLSKHACFSEVTSTPVQLNSQEEYSTIKPKNILTTDSTNTSESLPVTPPNGVVQGMSSIKPFSPLIKGMPHSNSMPTVTITPPQVVTTRSSLSHNSSLRGSGNIVSSLRSRISNASLFRYREEMRAARISVLVIIMALVNWLPYCALVLLYSNVLNTSLDIPHYVDALGLLFLSSGAVISPCLFAYRNRKLQREVKKVLGLNKSKREDGSSRRDDTCRGDTNITVAAKKKLKNWPLVGSKNRSKMESAKKFWDWRYWKRNPNQESRFIESNLLQHNVEGLRCETAKDAGLLLSCMKGSRWVRQEGTCDLATLHNTALRTSVDTCRSSFSSGGSTNSTQCTSSSLETALD